MAKLSPVRLAMPTLRGIEPIHRGKVRDTYDLGNGLLVVVATDAVSIFDFVLNAWVPRKGMVLTVMAHFFLTLLDSWGFKTHLVAAGSAIDGYIPDHLRHLRGDPYLQSHVLVVRRLKMYQVEFVFRNHFVASSSAFKAYDPESGGTICGHALPKGLQDGDRLPETLDTPTTKAEEGADEPRDYREVRAEYPRMSETFFDAFKGLSAYTRHHGRLITADWKGEGGIYEPDGAEYIGDEGFTPACTRLWDVDQWLASQAQPIHQSPPPYDKQIVRAEGIRLGIRGLDPKNPVHIAQVQKIRFSDGILEKTSDVYAEAATRPMKEAPEHYLEHKLGVEGYV